MWQCVSSCCGGNGSTSARTTSVGTTPSPSSTPPLTVIAIPTSPLAPLYFDCRVCSLRMVACECCHMLLPADREVDGVLLCNRCGFLTVLDAKLRALVHIPPFSREIVTYVTPSVGELEQLRRQWMEWDVRVRISRQHALSEGHAEAESGDVYVTPTQKKRRCPGDDQSAMSEPMLPPTPPAGGNGRMPPELKAEGKRLQAEINTVKRQWQRLMEEAAAGSTTAQELQSMHTPMFSSTHLHILRIMYEKAFERAELSELVAQIEQFLLQQSMIVKTKYDLLSGVRSYQHTQPLQSISDDSNVDPSPQQAAQLVIHCSKLQVQHLQSMFDKTARPFLKLVSIANKHLFALYNAAQSLSKLQDTLDTQSKDSLSLGGVGSNASSPSLLRLPENSRKRRMFGSATSSTHSHSPGSRLGPGPSSEDGSASRVQHVIEMRHRVSEIAKKVDVWRSLSFTIASTCVLSLLEIAQVEAEGSH